MYSLAHKFAWLVIASLPLFMTAGGVNAAIHACPTSDGSTIFQDQPCPRKVPTETPSMATARAPLDIHDSWFVKPAQHQARAFCDSRSCECDKFERTHKGSLPRAIADALYIDASWHHYDVSEASWQQTPVNSAKRYELRAELIEASCNVLMSQQLLKQFAEETVKGLKDLARQAEERGFDIPDACDNGNDRACEMYDALELYRRLVRDAAALRQSRDSFSGL